MSAVSCVAPHAGAWIETSGVQSARHGIGVVPHAGAWIETTISNREMRTSSSPPMRGRGLKHDHRLARRRQNVVAPHAGAWIETSEYPRLFG